MCEVCHLSPSSIQMVYCKFYQNPECHFHGQLDNWATVYRLVNDANETNLFLYHVSVLQFHWLDLNIKRIRGRAMGSQPEFYCSESNGI